MDRGPATFGDGQLARPELSGRRRLGHLSPAPDPHPYGLRGTWAHLRARWATGV